ncbi:MAG TPA: hypothetical protein VH253_00865 [Phycisphaerae bacterium]|nr:hypothetical protein [Phycisphaerae bacterium]
MTNVGRPLPSVEIAKLNVGTMREISGMKLGIEALEHQLETVHAILQEPLPQGLSEGMEASYTRNVASLNGAVQAAKSKCAEARAALQKLQVDLQH